MAVGTLISDVLFAPLFVVIVLCKLALWIKVLYLQKGSLNHISGPQWARWTRFWIVKTLASGESAERFVEVNKRYGPLARIGPNHLITADPELTKRILSGRSGYTRGPWFDSIRIDPHIPNIVSERDALKHDQLRAKLAGCFTGSSINAMEPKIDKLIVDWISQLQQRWMPSGSVSSFDIGKRIQFLTVDIISKICLGKALGCVESDSDKYGFLETVQQGNMVCQHFSVLLELNTLIYHLTKIPFIGKLMVPGPADKTGVGKIMGIVHDAVNGRSKAKEAAGTSMIDVLLSKGMPVEQLDAELVIALVAGSDTTSTSVQSTLLAIIMDPKVYQKLNLEIATAVQDGSVSYPVQYSEAKKLPYLQACIFEGLRKFPPLSQLRERMVPAEGDIIYGHRIPGGTYIGLNAWGTQLDDVFGDDPETFQPERWLTCDTDRLKAMQQTQKLIFGYGSTRCLGSSMAMMELSKMIFEMLRHFDIAIANPYKPWTSVCYGIFFQKDFNVHMSRAGPPPY